MYVRTYVLYAIYNNNNNNNNDEKGILEHLPRRVCHPSRGPSCWQRVHRRVLNKSITLAAAPSSLLLLFRGIMNKKFGPSSNLFYASFGRKDLLFYDMKVLNLRIVEVPLTPRTTFGWLVGRSVGGSMRILRYEARVKVLPTCIILTVANNIRERYFVYPPSPHFFVHNFYFIYKYRILMGARVNYIVVCIGYPE